MAAPPKLKGLLKEDFPEAPEWFGKLAETLNPFLSDTGAALSGRLSLSDNVACAINTFKFTMPATQTDARAHFEYRNASTSIPNNSATVVKYSTVVVDNRSAYSASTGNFTAPEAGVYFFSAGMLLESGAYTDIEIQLAHNTSVKNAAINQIATGGYNSVNVQAILDMTAGDTAQVYGYQLNGATATRSVWNDARFNYFLGHQLSGPTFGAASCFPLTYKAEIKGSAFKPRAVLIAALRDTTGAVHNAGTPTWEWDGKGNVKILNIPGLTYGRTYEVTFLTF